MGGGGTKYIHFGLTGFCVYGGASLVGNGFGGGGAGGFDGGDGLGGGVGFDIEILFRIIPSY
jgi:hypothetical protein